MEYSPNFNNVQIIVAPKFLSVLAYVFKVVSLMLTSHKRRFCLLTLHVIKAPYSENYAPENNMGKYFPSFSYLKIAEYFRDENICDGR